MQEIIKILGLITVIIGCIAFNVVLISLMISVVKPLIIDVYFPNKYKRD